MKFGKCLAAMIFVMLHLWSFTAIAEDSVFYSDEGVSISWPSSVAHVPCSETLQAKAGVHCAQIGADGGLGAVFMTAHSGYSLGTPELLEKHLKSSEGALSDIRHIHVMQSRVISTEPLLGMLELLRNDGTLQEIPAFAQSVVRQTSLLIPTGDRLVQVFIYLPEDSIEGARVYEALVSGLQSGIRVMEQPAVPQGVTEPEASTGVVSLLPRALFLGILITAVLILIFSMQQRIRRRRRQREARLQDAQVNAEIEIPSMDDENNQGLDTENGCERNAE